MQPTTRQDWADIAKGIGIVLVVLGHVARGMVRAGQVVPQPFFDHLDRILYSFHMPLFFLLSGWFAPRSLERRGAGATIANRVDTLVWPYILWSLFQGSLEVLLSRWTNGDTPWISVLSLLWAPRGQFWFLHSLFLIAVVFAAGWWLAGRRVLIVFLAVTFVGWLMQGNLATQPIVQQVLVNGFWFALGAYFGGMGFDIGRIRRIFVVVPFVAFVLTHAIAIQLGIDPTRGGILGLMAGATGILSVIGLSATLSGRVARVFLSLGTTSMGIYLMHILIGSGMRIAVEKALPSLHFTASLLGITVAATMIPWWATRWLEHRKIAWPFTFPISQWVAARRNTSDNRSSKR